MKIGVIGLGRLGSVLAEVLAEHNEVVGVDKDDDFSVLKDCEVVFNVVNTPSKENGNFDDSILFESTSWAVSHLKKCKVYVVVCTVMPGTCRNLKIILPDCKVCYNPEFIRLNSIKKDMKNPDFVLIGEEDKESGEIIEKIYRQFVNNFALGKIKRMSWESAELAKITLNSYITMKITFANILGQIAKKIGADATQILDAIGQDYRIGTSYFKHGGAYGGPCFPRDNIAFSNVAGDIKNYALLTDEINKIVAAEGYFSDEERYMNIL